jgi:hypothetical protein
LDASAAARTVRAVPDAPAPASDSRRRRGGPPGAAR